MLDDSFFIFVIENDIWVDDPKTMKLVAAFKANLEKQENKEIAHAE